MDTEKIENLIRLYASIARNLREVAEAAAERDPDSLAAQRSRAKANVYEVVVDDLKNLLAGKDV